MKFTDVRKYITGLLSASFVNKEVLDNLAENESGSLTYKGAAIEGGGSVTIDSELSIESENPVQNKVITQHMNNIVSSLVPWNQQITSFNLQMGSINSSDSIGSNADMPPYNTTRIRFEYPIYLEKGDYIFTSSNLTHYFTVRYPKNYIAGNALLINDWVLIDSTLHITENGWYRFAFKNIDNNTIIFNETDLFMTRLLYDTTSYSS